MKTAWKDTSSFSQSDKDRTPNQFTYQTKSLRIIIHRRMHMGDLWFWSCYEIGKRDREMLAVTVEQAQKEALRDVRCSVAAMLDELGKPE
jgi:hypothetical protein